MITEGLKVQDKKYGSSYDLVLMAAQRAKQIQEGAAPLIKTASSHPLSIALEEIALGAYPPPEKEAPKDLDEAFITAALAEQNLSDLDSRFALTLGTGTEAETEDEEDEE